MIQILTPLFNNSVNLGKLFKFWSKFLRPKTNEVIFVDSRPPLNNFKMRFYIGRVIILSYLHYFEFSVPGTVKVFMDFKTFENRDIKEAAILSLHLLQRWSVSRS